MLILLATLCQFVWPTYIRALTELAESAKSANSADRLGLLDQQAGLSVVIAHRMAALCGGGLVVEGIALAVQILLWQGLGCLLSVQADYELKKIGLAARAMILTATCEHIAATAPRHACVL
eukprot:SAG31_NODE_854_length_11497_cov_8.245043_9_plen_121_part_00